LREILWVMPVLLIPLRAQIFPARHDKVFKKWRRLKLSTGLQWVINTGNPAMMLYSG
jgi:hypothetical protein